MFDSGLWETDTPYCLTRARSFSSIQIPWAARIGTRRAVGRRIEESDRREAQDGAFCQLLRASSSSFFVSATWIRIGMPSRCAKSRAARSVSFAFV